jgi:hypothetical protein
MTSLLPDDAQDEIPVGFAIVGHVGMDPSFAGKSFLTQASAFKSPR